MSTLSIPPNTFSAPPNTITLHSANKEVLRITHDGRLVTGEGLSADEATQEAAKLLIASFEEQIQKMVETRIAAEREKVRVLREALEQVGELVEQMVCVPISEEPVVSAKAYGIIALTVAADISADIDAALAATKEGAK